MAFFLLKTNRHHCLQSLLPSFTFLGSSQTGMSFSSCLDSWSSLSGRKLSVHTQTTWQTLFIFCLCAWTSFVCYIDTVVSSQSGMGILSWPSALDCFAQWIGFATFHIVFGITFMSSQTGMTLRQWNMPTLPCYFLLVHNWCTLHMLTFKDCHILFSIVCLVTVILSSQTGMTWLSMSDNTIHPSLGWAQHVRTSQIFPK